MANATRQSDRVRIVICLDLKSRPIFSTDLDGPLAIHDAYAGQIPRNRPDRGGDRFTLTPQFAGGSLSRKIERGKVPPFLGDCPMQDRRQTTRDKVLYGGVADTGEAGSAKNCVVRNISG